MLKKFKVSYEANTISDKKYNFFRVEKGCKFLVIISLIGSILGAIGCIVGPLLSGPVYKAPFLFFIIFLAVAEFLLISYFLFRCSVPANVAIMTCVEEELRPQAEAVSIFIGHLLGDVPSPFLIGAVNDENMYWGTILAINWHFIAVLLWAIAFKASVFFI